MLSDKDILYINDIVYKAGQEILKIYQTSFYVETKLDKSPLTMADKNSHLIIKSGLEKRFPDIPILSEEGREIPYSERSMWEYFWLIDPLDGTKEFIKKNDEFTINIALIRKGSPVFGSVYAPCIKELFWAAKGMGAWKIIDKKDKKAIQVSQSRKNKKKIVISRSHPNEKVLKYLEQFQDYELIRMGSSLKLCIIAEGKADIYPRLGPTSEWDIAASQCIIEEAGGKVLDYEKDTPLRYNKKNILNPFFIVSA